MSRTKSAVFQFNATALVLDFFFLVTLFLFATGGDPLLQGPLAAFAASKPAIYRFALAFHFLFAAVLLSLLEWETSRSGKIMSFFHAAVHEALNRPALALPAMFLWSASLWTFSSWARHESFSTGFDMAIFSQAIAQGDLYSSIKGGINLLGDHFSPVLYAFTMLWQVWPDPQALLLAQAAAAASGIFPLYRLSQALGLDRRTGLIAAAAYLLYLPLANSVRYDFHPEVAAAPLFLWALDFSVRGRLGLSSLCLFAALLSKENAALSTAAVGLWALTQRRWIFGLFWIGFSAAYFFIVIKVVIPALSGQEYAYLGNFLGWKREGLDALARHLASPGSVVYLVKIFFPLGFLSLLDPLALLTALPALTQNLTARNEMVRSIGYQYTAFLTPFIFFAALSALKRLGGGLKPACLMLACSILMAGAPEYAVGRSFQKRHFFDYRIMQGIFLQIPAGAGVRTHEVFAPHFSRHRELHIYENNHPREGGRPEAQNAEYTVVDERVLGPGAAAHYEELSARGYTLLSGTRTPAVFVKQKTE